MDQSDVEEEDEVVEDAAENESVIDPHPENEEGSVNEAYEDEREDDHVDTSIPGQVAEETMASPQGLNQRIPFSPQELQVSSPIRPAMILKRQLRDADTLFQRSSQVPEIINKSPTAPTKAQKVTVNQEDEEQPPAHQHGRPPLYRLPQRQFDVLVDQSGVQSSRSFMGMKDSYQKRPGIDWAVPVNPARPRPLMALGDAKHRIVEKPKGSITVLWQCFPNRFYSRSRNQGHCQGR